MSDAFLDRLMEFFSGMDRAYARSAEAAGFHCEGCEDTCCRTWFHHHTLLEYYNLVRGFEALDWETREEARKKAREILSRHRRHKPENGPFRAICPLNRNGKCLVYAHRPMICRLHGVPHRLVDPHREERFGQGCHEYDTRALLVPDKGALLDRTPFYRDLAELEQLYRRHLGRTDRMRLTVAEMIAAWEEEGLFKLAD